MKKLSQNLKIFLGGIIICVLYSLMDVLFVIVDSNVMLPVILAAILEWLTLGMNVIFFCWFLAPIYLRIVQGSWHKTWPLLIITLESLCLRPFLMYWISCPFFPHSSRTFLLYLKDSLVEILWEIGYFTFCILFLFVALKIKARKTAKAQNQAFLQDEIPPREDDMLPFSKWVDVRNPLQLSVILFTLLNLIPTIVSDVLIYPAPHSARTVFLVILYYLRDVLICGILPYMTMIMLLEREKEST